MSERALPDPIKVNWTGYGRGRLAEYAGSWASSEDGPVGDRAERFSAVHQRWETQIEVRTVEEAEAVLWMVEQYASQPGQYVWMNGSMAASFRRVRDAVREALGAQGYEVETPHRGTPTVTESTE